MYTFILIVVCECQDHWHTKHLPRDSPTMDINHQNKTSSSYKAEFGTGFSNYHVDVILAVLSFAVNLHDLCYISREWNRSSRCSWFCSTKFKKHKPRGFIKGRAPGKLIGCGCDFARLLSTSQRIFSFFNTCINDQKQF